MATVSSSLHSDKNLVKHEGMDSLSRYQLCRLPNSEASAWTVRGRATTIDIRNPFNERGGTPRQRQLPDSHLPLGEMTSIKSSEGAVTRCRRERQDCWKSISNGGTDRSAQPLSHRGGAVAGGTIRSTTQRERTRRHERME